MIAVWFVQEIEVLAWVNVARPPPQQWIDTYEVMRGSLQHFVGLMPESSAARAQAEQVLENDITLEFFTNMLSRLHINSFRCSNPDPDPL